MIEKIIIDKVGSCYQKESVVLRKGSKKEIEFPALIAIIKHKKYGNILYDTGYSDMFFDETKKYPAKIYRKLTKVIIDTTIEDVLEKYNLKMEDINYVFVSHFHPDHIGNLHKFVNARIFCSKEEYTMLINERSNLKKLKHGFFEKMIPDNISESMISFEELLNKNIKNHTKKGRKLFEDNNLIAIPLYAHRKGQHGLLVNYNNKKYFFVSDSIWVIDNIHETKPSFGLKLVFENFKLYNDEIKFLKEIGKNTEIIPSHCISSFYKYKRELNDKL